jgi:hypothetical protein
MTGPCLMGVRKKKPRQWRGSTQVTASRVSSARLATQVGGQTYNLVAWRARPVALAARTSLRSTDYRSLCLRIKLYVDENFP